MDFLMLFVLASELLLVTSDPMKACMDLKTYMALQSNDPDKPYKCPPSGMSYGYEEFCNSIGDVESCFPWNISDNDMAILEWCQKPDTKIKHLTCKYGCLSKFQKNNSSLYCSADPGDSRPSDHITQPTVRDITSSKGQDCNPCDYQAAGGNTTSKYETFTWICLPLLILFLVENIVLFVRYRHSVCRFLRCKDDQGRKSSAMRLSKPDNHEQDIGKGQFRNLLDASGDKK